MDVRNTWVDRLQMRTVRWLVKGPGATWLIAGTFAFAGAAAASLHTPSGVAGQQGQSTIGTPALSMSAMGCYNDPDGDGHIFCDGSVAISRLPASFGYCYNDPDGDGHIFCSGKGN